MGIFLAYFLPLIISLAFTAFWSNRWVRQDLTYHKCLSIGTVVSSIFLFLAALTPGINVISTFLQLIFGALHFEEEIQAFMNKPFYTPRSKES